MKILKSNEKVLVSEELINKKNYFLFNFGSFRIFYSTFTKRYDFKKNCSIYMSHSKNYCRAFNTQNISKYFTQKLGQVCTHFSLVHRECKYACLGPAYFFFFSKQASI
jgi:hypothetical protein